MLSLLIGWTLWQHRGGVIPRIPFTAENLRSALWAARWEMPLPFVVLGGVFGGYFAISEAAAVTAAYVVLAEVVLYKEVAWRQLSKVAVESMVMVGGILMILGIALAFTAAARGYKLVLTMPESMSIERRRVMAVMGAEIVLTEAAKGMPGAIAKAKEIADSNPSKFFMPGQFDNPANPEIHFKTTGPEIWNDCDGAIDVFVAGVGTGGTITGVSRYIKNEAGKAIESVAVEPNNSPVITQTMNGETVKPGPHKIQGIGAGFIPKNLDLSVVDRVEQVTNEESIAMALRLAEEEGLLVGISCGAAAAAAIRLAEQDAYAGKTIVVVLPDLAERYISSVMFAEVPTGIIEQPVSV